MFTQIKTSKKNKDVVVNLTRILNLGTENNIARIAMAYSLSTDVKLDINTLEDSGGKEYSKSVLFGEYYDFYVGLISVHYNLYISDKEIPKYIKLHIDHGLSILDQEINARSNIDGYDFLIEKISHALEKSDNA